MSDVITYMYDKEKPKHHYPYKDLLYYLNSTVLTCSIQNIAIALVFIHLN